MNVGELKKLLEDVPNSVDVRVSSYPDKVTMSLHPSADLIKHDVVRASWTNVNNAFNIVSCPVIKD